MVTIEEIQAAYYMVAATGVLVAAIFYVLNLRVQQRNMRLNQETRQILLLLDYGESRDDTFRSIKLHNAMRNAQWDNYQDFRTRYFNDENVELMTYRAIKFNTYHKNGLMIRDGLMDIGTFVEYNGDSVVEIWRKYKDIILKTRKAYHLPTYLIGMEYLAEEIDRYRVKMGWGSKTPDDFSQEYLYSPQEPTVQ